MVAITGQVGQALIGRDAFQETRHHRHHAADHQAQLSGAVGRRDRPDDQGGVLPGAIRPTRAGAGRHPEERLSAKARSSTCRATIDRRGYQPSLLPNMRQVRLAGEMINAAKKPLIMAGHGIMISGAEQEFRAFRRADRHSGHLHAARPGLVPGIAPAVARPDGYARSPRGQHGAQGVRSAGQHRRPLRRPRHRQGLRLSRRTPGSSTVDIDPAEIGKNVATDVPVVGDAREVLKLMLGEVERARA